MPSIVIYHYPNINHQNTHNQENILFDQRSPSQGNIPCNTVHTIIKEITKVHTVISLYLKNTIIEEITIVHTVNT